jgi:chromosome segregation ATPase
VIEEQTIAQGIALLNTDVNSLVYYQGRGEIPQAVRAALARVISAKQELTALEQQLRRQQGELATIKQGQDRLRQNIAAVGADSLLGKRYLAKLSAEEDQIEKLDREALDLQTRIDTKRRELVEMLKGLDVS